MTHKLSLPENNRLTLNVPGYGNLPIRVERAPNGKSGLVVQPGKSDQSTYSRLSRLNKSAVVRLRDPNLGTTYRVIKNQKIVLLTEQELKQLQAGEIKVGLVQGNKRRVTHRPLSIEYTVGECPDSETSDERSRMVLLEWADDSSQPLPRGVRNSPQLVFTRNGSPVEIEGQFIADNTFIISPDDTVNPPAAPPYACNIASNSVLSESDFKTLTPTDVAHYRDVAKDIDGPTVAVIDTGLKFNFKNINSEVPPDGPYQYIDQQGKPRHFVLAFQETDSSTCNGMAGNQLGYCAICRYKQADFVAQTTSKLTSDTPPLPGCNADDIRNSPFDDHRILSGTGAVLDGRHGTSISAIIQQRAQAKILPIKAFDNQGYSSLFDVLNAFNYVLHRQRTDTIRVVNASWISGRNEPLLRKKIDQLMQAGVFVIAAAGNVGQSKDPDLNNVNLYPACYSAECPNVITVTTVARTYRTVPRRQRSDSSDTTDDPIEQVLNDERQRRVILRKFRMGEMDLQFRAAGFVAVENHSPLFVNVGVVGNLQGRFISPVKNGGWLDGSSFACGYVSAFVAEQLRAQPDLISLSPATTLAQQTRDARQQLLNAMTGTDPLLAMQGVAGGRYLVPQDPFASGSGG